MEVLGAEGRRWRRATSIPLHEGDLVVCWGEEYTHNIGTIKTLNNLPHICKLEELKILLNGGVRTPNFAPGTVPGGLEGWLPRRSNHQGGSDLLHPPTNPDFWVKKLDFTHEFRVHILNGVSIRSGIKVPRDGYEAHPWIRSYSGGWKLAYGSLCQNAITQKVRNAAKKAVGTLGLDFGAVDIGTLPNGDPVVLEVNRAPGVEGKTAEVYAEKFRLLSEG